VVFYILMCGQPPFYGNSDREIMASVKRGQFKFEKDLWKDYSQEIQEFIKCMLVMDPKKRPTAAELQQHPWINHNTSITEVPLTTTVMTNLRSFRARDRLQKTALTVMAKYVDEKSVEELREMFGTMDKNGDGTLTFSEVKEGMKKAGMELGPDIDDILKGLDSDESGEIDYSEFLAAAMGRRAYQQYDILWQVFRQFDINRSGAITKDDLTFILSGGQTKTFETAIGLQKDEIDHIMAKHDTDKSGDIDFDEFMVLIKDAGGLMRGNTLDIAAGCEKLSDSLKERQGRKA